MSLSNIVSHDQLINLQKHDRSLLSLFDQALVGDFPISHPYYFVRDDMLMHHDIQSKMQQETIKLWFQYSCAPSCYMLLRISERQVTWVTKASRGHTSIAQAIGPSR